MKIHINAGHGGKDPGACGYGIREKDVALSVTKFLGERLSKIGFGVCYTRLEDMYIAPLEIARQANADNANLFISIHTNAAASISANGIETLCYNLDGDEGKIAEAVQKKLIEATGLTDRGVKERTDLVVLNSTKMPAILVELGFITNQSDNAMLSNLVFLENSAKAIAEGICDYYGIKYKEEEIMAKTEEIPQWQTDGLKKLVEAGIVNDEAYWQKRMGETITAGELVGLLGKMVK